MKSKTRLTRSRAGAVAVLIAGTVAAAAPAAGAAARDPLAEARQFYNNGDFDGAIVAAEQVVQPPLVHPAKLVAGRARLERFRRARAEADLTEARAALVSVDPRALAPLERLELVIGFAESLFLEGSFGASAELFASVIDQPAAWQAAGTGGRDRLLEWWAGAVDREAQLARGPARDEMFARLRDRMARELERDPASPVASYWLAAAARSAGDIDRAWDAAVAGWLRARLAGARSQALSNDLDRLVRESIIPARAKRRADSLRDAPQLEADMLTEWNELKTKWPIPSEF
jgi:hypothetical protein